MAKTLDILAGIGKGYMQAASNIFAISQAQEKLKQERDMFDIKKKQYKLDLRKAEYELSPEALERKKKMDDAELKLDESTIAAKEVTTKIAKSEEMRNVEKHEAGMKVLEGLTREDRGEAGAPSIPGTPYQPSLPEGVSLDLGAVSMRGVKQPALTPEQTRKAGNEKQKALALLERGFYTDAENKKQPLNDRTDAEELIAGEFDVDITDPDIQTALEQYKPAEETIDEVRWFEEWFGKQKYPTKEKYGYKYERREDNKWHRIEE